jgi:hypothetical protein
VPRQGPAGGVKEQGRKREKATTTATEAGRTHDKFRPALEKVMNESMNEIEAKTTSINLT